MQRERDTHLNPDASPPLAGAADSSSSAGPRPAPPDFRLHYDALGRLVLTDHAGREYKDVEPIRAFPIAEPDRGISICDEHGHELFWIERLADLPAEARAAIELDLSRREFIPVIQRIVRMAAFAEPSEWEVETDRGPTRFLLGNEEDVHRLDGGRAMIVDTNGVRYLIPDTNKLDHHSRRILERYL